MDHEGDPAANTGGGSGAKVAHCSHLRVGRAQKGEIVLGVWSVECGVNRYSFDPILGVVSVDCTGLPGHTVP